MSIQDLPDELLLQMCENWTTKTLVNMSEAYSKVYQVCSKIIEKRKDENKITKLKNCIRKAVENAPDLNEEPLKLASKNGTDELEVVIEELYPIFKKEDQEMEDKYGEASSDVEIEWDEEKRNQMVEENAKRWFNMVIDRLEEDISLYALAMVTQRFLDDLVEEEEEGEEEKDKHDYQEFKNCVPINARYYIEYLEDDEKFWF